MASACLFVFSVVVYLPVTGFAQFLFRDVTSASGIYMRSRGAGVVVCDFNNDGWDDIYMPGGDDSDKIYFNMQDGTFKDVTPLNVLSHSDTGSLSWRSSPRGGIAFDYDNDGYPDLYCCCENSDLLWHNNGDGTFTDASVAA